MTHRSSHIENDNPMGVSREDVKKVITNNMGPFLGCYEKSLSLDRTLEGKIVLDWQIVTGGKVESAKINEAKTEIKDPKMRECMIQKISALNFPEPVNISAVDVTYPFFFKDAKQ